ncbi:hypothetical protein BJV78DRAFT_1156685 [Lactifluus subvellereus]|nr:hypothetical protein BJV78DRAFT_1156685 [Lactifluus subvellereus]
MSISAPSIVPLVIRLCTTDPAPPPVPIPVTEPTSPLLPAGLPPALTASSARTLATLVGRPPQVAVLSPSASLHDAAGITCAERARSVAWCFCSGLSCIEREKTAEIARGKEERKGPLGRRRLSTVSAAKFWNYRMEDEEKEWRGDHLKAKRSTRVTRIWGVKLVQAAIPLGVEDLRHSKLWIRRDYIWIYNYREKS